MSMQITTSNTAKFNLPTLHLDEITPISTKSNSSYVLTPEQPRQDHYKLNLMDK